MQNTGDNKVNPIKVAKVNSIPKNYFRYGICEICKENLVLPLVPADDKFSRLAWSIYMIKVNELPKLCWRCKSVYDQEIGTPKVRLKVTREPKLVVSLEDYDKSLEFGLIDERLELC